jgi:hypothetical protein
MASDCNGVAHSVLSRLSTAVTLATISPPPLYACVMTDHVVQGMLGEIAIRLKLSNLATYSLTSCHSSMATKAVVTTSASLIFWCGSSTWPSACKKSAHRQ